MDGATLLAFHFSHRLKFTGKTDRNLQPFTKIVRYEYQRTKCTLVGVEVAKLQFFTPLD